MQRRGRPTAYISPPPASRMSSTTEKSSRLNRRTLGVTHRIWSIIAFVLLVLCLTNYILPSNRRESPRPYTNYHLKSKNYLNNSDAEPDPFEFCPVYGPGDALGAKYGSLTLSQSRMHLGSSARIQRVISRALAGQPVTISIIGGSVSACHGAGDDPISPKCYPSRFFQWWNSVFPHPATELTNGAMRRTTSDYFGFCSMHHIPDVTDLVIIELDTDDTPDSDMMENFENLVRSILIRQEQPAVLLLGSFSPQIHQRYGFAGPDHLHNVAAQFYDIPHISTKAVLFGDYMRDPASITKYYVDPILASPLGHELISDVLVSYMQMQICSAWAVATGSSYDTVPNRGGDRDVSGEVRGLFGGMGIRKGVPEPGSDSDTDDTDVNGNRNKLNAPANNHIYQQLSVPPGRINTRPNSGRAFQEIEPFCVSANDLINPLPPSLFFGSGWLAFHPSAGSSALQVKSHYWYSTLPSSKLRIPVHCGAGDIGVYYVQEPISEIGTGTAVECWVDDNYAGAKTIENAADVGESRPALKIIDHFVSKGSHFVECKLLGEEGTSVPMFKIMGIFST